MTHVLSGKQVIEPSYLVDLFYQGATNPACWWAALAALCGYLDTPYGCLLTPMHTPATGGYFFLHNIPAGIIENWTRYLPYDIYAKALAARGSLDRSGSIVTGNELVPRYQLEKSVFYRDYMARYGFEDMIACTVFGKDAARLIQTTLNFYRGREQKPFCAELAEKIALFLPHISRALGVMQWLRDSEFRIAADLTALDNLKHAVLLIGEDTRVTYANARAMRMLKEEDGLRLYRHIGTRPGDRLMASDPAIQRIIERELHTAVWRDLENTAHFIKVVSVVRPSLRLPYELNFSSLPLDNPFGTGSDLPHAIVFIRDSEQHSRIDTELLRSTYRLTPAETRVALLLLSGETTEEIADRCGVSINTLKTQLQQIYAKTGTGNRAKLVRLLFSMYE